MRIIAFGASSSKNSINKQFAEFAAKQFKNAYLEVLDLNHYKLPLFTVDLEKEKGHPKTIPFFISKLEEADLLIISMAEHNGSYTAAFKNLFDWTSRVKLKMFEGKKMLLLSTSPGGRGGASVMETALKRFPVHGAEIIAHFSLPSFSKNFDPEKGITDDELKKQFDETILAVRKSIIDKELREAVSRHDVKAVEECLLLGADPNHFVNFPELDPGDEDQPTTPLRLVMFCISDSLLEEQDLKQFEEVAKLLLKYGADPKPAMDLAELRYGKYDPNSENRLMGVWRIVANAKK